MPNPLSARLEKIEAKVPRPREPIHIALVTTDEAETKALADATVFKDDEIRVIRLIGYQTPDGRPLR